MKGFVFKPKRCVFTALCGCMVLFTLTGFAWAEWGVGVSQKYKSSKPFHSDRVIVKFKEDVSLNIAEDILETAGVEILK